VTVGVTTGREGKRKGSPPVFRPISRRRVKPRAATVPAVAEGLPCNFWSLGTIL